MKCAETKKNIPLSPHEICDCERSSYRNHLTEGELMSLHHNLIRLLLSSSSSHIIVTVVCSWRDGMQRSSDMR